MQDRISGLRQAGCLIRRQLQQDLVTFRAEFPQRPVCIGGLVPFLRIAVIEGLDIV